jgi:hypothetical protein
VALGFGLLKQMMSLFHMVWMHMESNIVFVVPRDFGLWVSPESPKLLRLEWLICDAFVNRCGLSLHRASGLNPHWSRNC